LEREGFFPSIIAGIMIIIFSISVNEHHLANDHQEATA